MLDSVDLANQRHRPSLTIKRLINTISFKRLIYSLQLGSMDHNEASR